MTAAPIVIGITGPIGCGKSTVAKLLGELGATIVDADVLSRDVTAPGEPTLDAIRSRFGEDVFDGDGSLDRAALAAVVFGDDAALADLEAIVHPQVRRRIESELARAATSADLVVVIEAIKLVEGGLAERCDEVWLVDCSSAKQRERLDGRGMAPEDVERRLAAQGPDLARRLASRATRTIRTDGSMDETREQVEDAFADALAPLLLGRGPGSSAPSGIG